MAAGNGLATSFFYQRRGAEDTVPSTSGNAVLDRVCVVDVAGVVCEEPSVADAAGRVAIAVMRQGACGEDAVAGDVDVVAACGSDVGNHRWVRRLGVA